MTPNAPTRSRRVRRGLAIALLLLAPAIAGCGGDSAPDPTGVLVSGSLRFALPPGSERAGNDVLWTFLIQNDGEAPSTPATLRIRVDYSHESGTMQATVPIPAIAPGDAQRFTARTAYRGLGSYRGMAELDRGGEVVARDALAFEDCGPCG